MATVILPWKWQKIQNLSIMAFENLSAKMEVAKRSITKNDLTYRADLHISMLIDFEASSGHDEVIVSKHLPHYPGRVIA